ncbi:hypothetical protein N7471_011022 [Penicillium samsonianum]|uniref:uncharacterized protein n=1 Tax=Penicillium samsonianum TaxID=1882272 RepID=UPI00254873D3|nr:uncharacterized protein N7471_011022 [Penicillium samsonianum]KAJ6123705.1 hypothetical protein N7471_011022 [Penicillium samsonianum]
MDEETVTDQHAELIERDRMLFLREARLQAALRSNMNAINSAQNELRLLLALRGQRRHYLNSKIEQREALLEELRDRSLQLRTDYDHTRAQRSDIVEFIHELLSS